MASDVIEKMGWWNRLSHPGQFVALTRPLVLPLAVLTAVLFAVGLWFGLVGSPMSFAWFPGDQRAPHIECGLQVHVDHRRLRHRSLPMDLGDEARTIYVCRETHSAPTRARLQTGATTGPRGQRAGARLVALGRDRADHRRPLFAERDFRIAVRLASVPGSRWVAGRSDDPLTTRLGRRRRLAGRPWDL